MDSFYTIRINKRVFSREEVTLDDSITELFYTQVADWETIVQWHKGIGSMPLKSAWKTSLRDHIFAGGYFSAYLIEKPTIVIYKWPTKEQRWFLVTRNGNLIEPPEYIVWDKYIPCICAENSGFSIRANYERVREQEIGRAIWFPNHGNFTHFLIDSFAPVAYLDQLQSKWIAESYYVPLVGNQPSWQAEYVDRLRLRKGRLDEGGYNCSLLILKPEALVLPLFSCKPAAYLPLRQFLCTRSDGTGEAIAPKKAGSGCIMLSRYDKRRMRIQNINQIETIVASLGGKVIDPSKLSIKDRLRIIGGSSLCIGEGSGTSNAFVYGPSSCKILNLTDPELLYSPEFLHGGWPYLIYQSLNSRFVVGSSRRELEGSPLGSAYYPVDRIIKEITDSV